MKKLILVFVAIAITAGAYAQNDSTNKKIQRTNNQDQNIQYNPIAQSHPDGAMMQNGKMMKVKNGQMTSLQGDGMTLSNGTKIRSDGTCIKKDGTKVMMKEGQHMDMSGKMTSMKANKDKNMYLVPDSTRK